MANNSFVQDFVQKLMTNQQAKPTSLGTADNLRNLKPAQTAKPQTQQSAQNQPSANIIQRVINRVDQNLSATPQVRYADPETLNAITRTTIDPTPTLNETIARGAGRGFGRVAANLDDIVNSREAATAQRWGQEQSGQFNPVETVEEAGARAGTALEQRDANLFTGLVTQAVMADAEKDAGSADKAVSQRIDELMHRTDWNDKREAAFQNYLKDKSEWEQIAGETAAQVTHMLPNIVANVGVTAATGSPLLGRAASMALLGASAAGGAAKSAWRKYNEAGVPITPQQAWDIGVRHGAVEVGTENIFGGIAGLGTGLADTVLKGAVDSFARSSAGSVLKAFTNSAAGKLTNAAFDTLGENIEESISDWFDQRIDNDVLGIKGEVPTVWEAIKGQLPFLSREGTITLMTSLILGAANYAKAFTDDGGVNPEVLDRVFSEATSQAEAQNTLNDAANTQQTGRPMSEAEAQYEAVKAENPDANVLTQRATDILEQKQAQGFDGKNLGTWSAEQGRLLDKVFSGEELTKSEMRDLDLNDPAVREVFMRDSGIEMNGRGIDSARKAELVAQAQEQVRTVQTNQAEIAAANEQLTQMRSQQAQQQAEQNLASMAKENTVNRNRQIDLRGATVDSVFDQVSRQSGVENIPTLSQFLESMTPEQVNSLIQSWQELNPGEEIDRDTFLGLASREWGRALRALGLTEAEIRAISQITDLTIEENRANSENGGEPNGRGYEEAVQQVLPDSAGNDAGRNDAGTGREESLGAVSEQQRNRNSEDHGSGERVRGRASRAEGATSGQVEVLNRPKRGRRLSVRDIRGMESKSNEVSRKAQREAARRLNWLRTVAPELADRVEAGETVVLPDETAMQDRQLRRAKTRAIKAAKVLLGKEASVKVANGVHFVVGDLSGINNLTGDNLAAGEAEGLYRRGTFDTFIRADSDKLSADTIIAHENLHLLNYHANGSLLYVLTERLIERYGQDTALDIVRFYTSHGRINGDNETSGAYEALDEFFADARMGAGPLDLAKVGTKYEYLPSPTELTEMVEEVLADSATLDRINQMTAIVMDEDGTEVYGSPDINDLFDQSEITKVNEELYKEAHNQPAVQEPTFDNGPDPEDILGEPPEWQPRVTFKQALGKAKRLFFGKNALNADLSRRDRAMAMFAETGDALDAYIREHWFQDTVDGQWRFEGDDSAALFNPMGGIALDRGPIERARETARNYFRGKVSDVAYNSIMGDPVRFLEYADSPTQVEQRFAQMEMLFRNALNEIEQRRNGQRPSVKYLCEYLHHPELYANYPELAFTEVELTDLGPRDTDGRTVWGDAGKTGNNIGTIIRLNTNPEAFGDFSRLSQDDEMEVLKSIIHETQHNIQDIEGFGSGGSPEMVQTLHEAIQLFIDDKLYAIGEILDQYGAFGDENARDDFLSMAVLAKKSAERNPAEKLYIGVAEDAAKRYLNSVKSHPEFNANDVREVEMLFEDISGAFDDMMSGGTPINSDNYNDWYQLLNGEKEAREAERRISITNELRSESPSYTQPDAVRVPGGMSLTDRLTNGAIYGSPVDLARLADKYHNELDRIGKGYTLTDISDDALGKRQSSSKLSDFNTDEYYQNDYHENDYARDGVYDADADRSYNSSEHIDTGVADITGDKDAYSTSRDYSSTGESFMRVHGQSLRNQLRSLARSYKRVAASDTAPNTALLNTPSSLSGKQLDEANRFLTAAFNVYLNSEEGQGADPATAWYDFVLEFLDAEEDMGLHDYVVTRAMEMLNSSMATVADQATQRQAVLDEETEKDRGYEQSVRAAEALDRQAPEPPAPKTRAPKETTADQAKINSLRIKFKDKVRQANSASKAATRERNAQQARELYKQLEELGAKPKRSIDEYLNSPEEKQRKDTNAAFKPKEAPKQETAEKAEAPAPKTEEGPKLVVKPNPEAEQQTTAEPERPISNIDTESQTPEADRAASEQFDRTYPKAATRGISGTKYTPSQAFSLMSISKTQLDSILEAFPEGRIPLDQTGLTELQKRSLIGAGLVDESGTISREALADAYVWKADGMELNLTPRGERQQTTDTARIRRALDRLKNGVDRLTVFKDTGILHIAGPHYVDVFKFHTRAAQDMVAAIDLAVQNMEDDNTDRPAEEILSHARLVVDPYGIIRNGEGRAVGRIVTDKVSSVLNSTETTRAEAAPSDYTPRAGQILRAAPVTTQTTETTATTETTQTEQTQEEAATEKPQKKGGRKKSPFKENPAAAQTTETTEQAEAPAQEQPKQEKPKRSILPQGFTGESGREYTGQQLLALRSISRAAENIALASESDTVSMEELGFSPELQQKLTEAGLANEDGTIDKAILADDAARRDAVRAAKAAAEAETVETKTEEAEVERVEAEEAEETGEGLDLSALDDATRSTVEQLISAAQQTQQTNETLLKQLDALTERLNALENEEAAEPKKVAPSKPRRTRTKNLPKQPDSAATERELERQAPEAPPLANDDEQHINKIIEDAKKRAKAAERARTTAEHEGNVEAKRATAGRGNRTMNQPAATEDGRAAFPINAQGAANAQEYQNRGPTPVPTKTLNGRLNSKLISTLINSGVTTNRLVRGMMAVLQDGGYAYDSRYTDKEAISKVEADLRKDGWQRMLSKWNDAMAEGRHDKNTTALGIVLLNNAANAGDALTAMDIASRMARGARDTARALQAFNIINKATPDGRLYMVMKSIQTMQDELVKRFGDRAPEINVNADLMQAYYEALLSGDADLIKETWNALADDLAAQVPGTWKEKFNNWRYLAMLGNPRTHVRNLAGNLGFAPVWLMKDILATGMEVLSGTDKRTKAFLGLGANDRGLLRAGWSDYDNVVELIQSGGKFSDDVMDDLQRRRRVYGLKTLEAFRRANGYLLDQEDTWFSRPAYAYALAGYLKANGVSAEAVNNGTVNPDLMAEAQAYAIKEAQKATYRDTNDFSEFVSQMGRYKGPNKFKQLASTALEAVLPFRKTPANIVARAFEYSPAGMAKALTVDLNKLSKGEITQAEFFDSLSAGLTGTGLLALGAYLAAQGLVKGSKGDDDKKEEFEKQQGQQNYAINIPGGKSVTLDWLAPEALPFFVGVEAYEAYMNSRQGEDGGTLKDFLDSLKGLADPILETSMLSSLQDLFKGIGYANGAELSNIAGSIAFSYLSQFFPTLLGQFERISENKRYETYRYEKSGILDSTGQYQLGSIMNKVPGAEYNQIDYVDAWGRTQNTGTFGERVINNLFNPAYVNNGRYTEVDNELMRLYDAGHQNVLPTRLKQSAQITLYDKEGNSLGAERLTGEEYVRYNKTRGRMQFNMVSEFLSSKAYRNMDDTERARVIADIYQYATAVANREFASGRGEYTSPDTWVERAMAHKNATAMDYILFNAAASTYDGSTTSSYIYAANSIGLTDKQADDLLVKEYLGNSAAEDYLTARNLGVSGLDYARYLDARDLNGNGSVNQYEKVAAAIDQGFSNRTADALVVSQLNEAKGTAYLRARLAGMVPQEYVNFLQAADANGNGSVSQDEARAALDTYIVTGDVQAIRSAIWSGYGWKKGY